VLSKTLATLIDRKLTTAREIGELTGVAPSTVYRWIRGESQPDFDAVRLLVRHLKKEDAIEAILSSFTAGTGWNFYNIESELDLNRDGVIDVDDALDASVSAVRGAGRSLAQVHKAHRLGQLTQEENVELIALLNDVIRQCSITQRILVHITENRRKRKLKMIDR